MALVDGEVPITTKFNMSQPLPEDVNEKERFISLEEVPVTTVSSKTDELCGIGTWRPKVLQKLANPRVFTVAFAVLGIVQGMIYSYFNGVLTTIEKTFGIQSSTFGIILSGNDISQILCGVLVTYIAGRGSRPFWLAISLVITATACFLYASAHLFWDGDLTNKIATANALANNTEHVLCSATGQMTNAELTQCQSRPSNIPALVIFFCGQFISGIGSTTLFSLGFTYMDDNVKKGDSPLYMAITTAVRSLGPTIGYMLASMCLKIYIIPYETPEYDQKNPRWLGAWWLGFLLVGLLQLLITIPLLLFPKQLPTKHDKIILEDVTKLELNKEHHEKTASLQDFFAAIRRLLKNPLVVFHIFSIGPLFLGIVGFSIFTPKYLEAQFGKTPSQASIFTGASGMMMMMIGSFLGGIIIWKFKPRAFYVGIWCTAVDIFYIAGLFIIMQFKCDPVTFSGVHFNSGSLVITSSCAKNCDCTSQFQPVCVGSENFLSPCLAGCTSFNTSTEEFFDCKCNEMIEFNDEISNEDTLIAKLGYCPSARNQCEYFWPYIIILGIGKVIASSTRVGGFLLLVRSVDKRDKAMTVALMGAAMSLFGFIPGPIIYGAVVDSTCLLWKQTPCGDKGNCWLYNLEDFRVWFHGITITCFIITTIFEMFIAVYSRQLNLYSEDNPGRVLSFKEGLRWKIESHTKESIKS